MANRVLFVISIFNYHREVAPLVEKYVDEGWLVDVLLGWRDQNALDASQSYEKLGANVIWVPEDNSYGEGFPISCSVITDKVDKIVPQQATQSLRNKIKACLLGNRLVQFAADLRYHSRKIGTAKQFISQALKLAKYDAIFQGPFHSVGKLDNAIYCQALIQRIPLFCYPVSAYHGHKIIAQARYDNIRNSMVSDDLLVGKSWINKFLSFAFKRWTISVDGVRFFLSTPSLMLASYFQKIELDMTWAKPQPNFDQVFVYSKFSRDLLDDDVFPIEKVSISGIPLLDRVIDQFASDECKEDILSNLGMGKDQDFILMNVEPSWEHHYCDAETHWSNFHKMLNVVTSFGLPVVLSLHPLCKLEDYEFAEQEYRVTISREHKIHSLYPLCRMVVSFACSTNIFSETFLKDLVIYDFFNMVGKTSPRAWEFKLKDALVSDTHEGVAEHIRTALSTVNNVDGRDVNLSKSCDHIYQTVETILTNRN